MIYKTALISWLYPYIFQILIFSHYYKQNVIITCTTIHCWTHGHTSRRLPYRSAHWYHLWCYWLTNIQQVTCTVSTHNHGNILVKCCLLLHTDFPTYYGWQDSLHVHFWFHLIHHQQLLISVRIKWSVVTTNRVHWNPL